MSLFSGLRRRGAADRESDWSAALGKGRPVPLEASEVTHLTVDEAADTWFSRLRESIVNEFGPSTVMEGGPRYLLETGVLDSDRAYLYLQPHNQRGLLVERAGDGWVLARADKIVSRDTFMRTGEAWDVVRVVGTGDGRLPKVSSRRFDEDLMPFSEYRKRLLEAIRCIG